MNDLVSIVLPVYNGERYLSESIDSVIAQTYSNWELIIIDDCSTDSTPEITKAYAEKDDRIRYYRNKKNSKLPQSLNNGFTYTKGDYLTWTSDDNRFRPNAIERLLSALKEKNVQFVFSAYSRMNENGEKIDDKVFEKNIAKKLPVQNVVGPSFMYTREVYNTVGEYDTGLFLTEDFDYWQRVYAKFGAVYIQEILYDYRMHGTSLTETKNEDAFKIILSKTLLKNRHLFGRFNIDLNYNYYRILSNGQEAMYEPNVYKKKFKFYSKLYYWRCFIPGVISRKVKKITNRS